MLTAPILLVAVVVALLVAAAIIVPGRKSQPAATSAIQHPFQLIPQLSIRQQQADESAAAVASYFRQADEAAWVEEQLDRAQAYMASRGKSSATSK